MSQHSSLWAAYKLRWNRRRLLVRSWRKRRELTVRANRTAAIKPKDILLFCTLRNEQMRLPSFLQHYRKLGVTHFLIVDNGSDDGTAALLETQKDVSWWRTTASYKASRFGMDWLGYLQLRYGHKHWCVTVDADELLTYAHHDTAPLPVLTDWMAQQGQLAMGALMLDMYPKGPVGDQSFEPDQDPLEALPWFDATGYRHTLQPKLRNIWLQGGPRDRMFFAKQPKRAPTLNKIPLVYWNRRFVYVTSSHQLLPRRLNKAFAQQGCEGPTGALLHTKFLPTILEKSMEEKARRQHFANSDLYDGYYDGLIANPDFWTPESKRFEGWQQLVDLDLIQRGAWKG